MNKFIWLLLGLFGATLLSAQAPETALFRWRITDYSGTISGDYRIRNRSFDQSAIQGEYNRGLTRGLVELDSRGSIYHPLFFDYLLNLDLGYNQSHVSRKSMIDQREVDRGISRNILFQGRLLSRKPLNFTLEYLRQHRQLNREIFYIVNSFTRRYGARLNYRNQILPGSLSYSEIFTRDSYSSREITTTENRLGFSANHGSYKQVNGRINVNYTDYQRVDEGFYQSNQHYFKVRHALQIPFDSARDNIIYSNALFTNITGTRDFTNFFWNGRSTSRITETLTNSSRITYRESITPGAKYNAQTIASQLNHQLYESLNSSAELIYRRLNEQGFLRQTVSPKVGLNYQKLLPVGRLQLNAGVNPNWVYIRDKENQPVTEEIYHSFGEENPVFLPRENILEQSIEILDPNRLILYIPEQDYAVQPYGNTFQILRLPGSQISDSTEVIIRYKFIADTRQRAHYNLWNYGISYRFHRLLDFVAGYSGYASRYESLAALNWWNSDEKDVNRLYLQLGYRSFSLDMSRETSNSSITPYTTNAIALNGLLGSYLKQYLLGRAQLMWQKLPLRDATQRQTYYTVEYFRKISRQLSVKAAWHERSIFSDLNQLREEKWTGTIKYQIPNFTFNLEYDFFKNRFFNSRETNQRWTFSLVLNP